MCGLERGIDEKYIGKAGEGLIELRRAGYAAMMRLPKPRRGP